jgi:DNA-directed RNA polymerase specialized sigma24 family protein
VRKPVRPQALLTALAEFEATYRANVDVVMAYFARRCGDPQTVADLTSDTFVRAAGAFGRFDPGSGSARAWLFGIAAHVFARHCAETAEARDTAARLAAHRALDDDGIGELAARIDAERAGRELLARCSELPALGVTRVVLRKRLSRARARLRKEYRTDE